MTEEERELDLQIGELQRENSNLKRLLTRTTDEAIQLRHALQHIYAKALLVLEFDTKEGDQP